MRIAGEAAALEAAAFPVSPPRPVHRPVCASVTRECGQPSPGRTASTRGAAVKEEVRPLTAVLAASLWVCLKLPRDSKKKPRLRSAGPGTR